MKGAAGDFFTFVTLKLTETNKNFHTKPVGGGPKESFSLENSTVSIILLNSSPNYSVHTLGWWVAEITPTHTMSIQSTLQVTPIHVYTCSWVWEKTHYCIILQVQLWKLKFRTSFYWNIILLVHFWKNKRLRRASFYWGNILPGKSCKIFSSKYIILLEHHFTGYVL